MGDTEVVLHINGWLLISLSVGGIGGASWIIYRLLVKLSVMTIAGIKHEIADCQKELADAIEDAHAKADRAHIHATNAHKRVGRIEDVLIGRGIKLLEKDG
jgi:hypothetical protein